jgi:hypothetical protein
MSISIMAVSFDARDGARLPQFWAEALHRTVNDGARTDGHEHVDHAARIGGSTDVTT